MWLQRGIHSGVHSAVRRAWTSKVLCQDAAPDWRQSSLYAGRHYPPYGWLGCAAPPRWPASSLPAGHKWLAGVHCASSLPCCSWKNYLRGCITELQQKWRKVLQPESGYRIQLREGLPACGIEKFLSIQAWLCKTARSPLQCSFFAAVTLISWILHRTSEP